MVIIDAFSSQRIQHPRFVNIITNKQSEKEMYGDSWRTIRTIHSQFKRAYHKSTMIFNHLTLELTLKGVMLQTKHDYYSDQIQLNAIKDWQGVEDKFIPLHGLNNDSTCTFDQYYHDPLSSLPVLLLSFVWV